MSRDGRMGRGSGREWDEELEFHIEGRARELMASGWTERDARAEARRRFGDVEGIRAELADIAWDRERRTRRFQMRDALKGDVRFALRALRRNPGFAAIAVLTLALGIGATTAIFSVVDGVLLRPLPVEDPDRLVVIFEANASRNIEEDAPSPPNYLDWKAGATRSFSGMAAYNDYSVTLTGVEAPEVLSAAGASTDYFDVLGVRPMLGRGFQAGDDENGAGVVVLSWGAWQRLFGGAPDILGRTMVLNGTPTEVIGVMSPDFNMPGEVDVWVPASMRNQHRQTRYLRVIARLAPGVTLAQAEQELNGVAAQLAQTYPVENGGWTTKLVPAREVLVRDVRAVLLVVLAAVGFVLLIACANVANLALGRATAREGEMAVRAALGASRTRLHLQMLTESIVLALLGGVAGAALAWGGVRAFIGFAPGVLPRVDEITVDARVLGFALGISVLTGVLFGLMPSLRVGGTPAAGALREGGRGGVGGRRSEVMRRALIIGEVALALLLLVGAGLTLRSVQRLLSVDPGYVTQDVIAARVSLDGERYRGNAAKVRYFDDLAERLGTIPGVQHVGVTSTLPLTPDGIDFNLPYHAEGHPDLGEERSTEVDYRIISPGYLDAMGIPLLAGRNFTSFDRIEGSPHAAADASSRVSAGELGAAGDAGGHKVMLVNETFAKQHWPGENAVGKRVRLYYVRNDQWEVVGVVGDTRHSGLATPSTPQVFVPLAQAELLFGYLTIVARTAPGAAGVVQSMRAAAVEMDGNEPLFAIETIETLRSEATARDRMAAVVFAAFALLAIALAAAGIYGVIAYQVARRTREIGVRIALGAGRSRVVRGVVGEAAGLALTGVVLGGIAALAATRLAEGMLFGVDPSDPLTYGAVSLLLLLVALAAALVPAARAAGIQPIEALRSD